jgi:hypothetical protein
MIARLYQSYETGAVVPNSSSDRLKDLLVRELNSVMKETWYEARMG